MKLTSYNEVLRMAKEKIEEAKIPFKAKQAKKQGELKLLELEEQVCGLELKVTELTSKHPLDYDCVMDAIDELDLASRRQKQMATIIKELFDAAD